MTEATETASCANCDWKGPIADLAEYRDFWSRVQPGDTVPAGDCPNCGAHAFLDEPAPDLAAQLRAMIADGLDLGVVLSAFCDHQKATEPHLDPYRDHAGDMNYVREGEVEIDDNAIVSKGDDAGAYVLGWVWVEDEVAGIETPEDDETEQLPGEEA